MVNTQQYVNFFESEYDVDETSHMYADPINSYWICADIETKKAISFATSKIERIAFKKMNRYEAIRLAMDYLFMYKSTLFRTLDET